MKARRLALVLALAAPACASTGQIAPEKQAPPSTPPERKPLTELEALEHDLLVTERRLDAQLARKREVSFGVATGKEDAPAEQAPTGSPRGGLPPAPPPPPADRAFGQPEGGAEEKGQHERRPRDVGEVGSACDVACRALRSMRRSAEKICELAGETSTRCARAKSRIARAADRVRDAGCECRSAE